MKKTLMALAAVAAITGFCGNQDAVLLTFSTKGPDAYQTGETVADKECYALVWTKAGETFGGFDAAGNVLGNGSVLIVAAPIARDGACPKVTFQLNASYVANYLQGSGTYALYLLDTRDANGVPLGTVVKDVSGRNANVPLCVNSWGAVTVDGEAATLQAENGFGNIASGSASQPISTTTVAPIPEGVDVTPVIKSAKVEDGKFKVTIEKPVPYMTYNLVDASSKETVGTTAKSGVVTETTTLETKVDAPSKLIRVSAERNQ